MAGWKTAKKVNLPELNEEFAELIGIHLGDGTLTKYFMRISGDKKYDLNYFNYICDLTEDLIGFRPNIRYENNSSLLYVEIRSVKFSSYLHEKFGIPFGNKIKNRAMIPSQILRDENLAKACLRGLVDTDGSISRRNNSMCLTFDSRNPYLLKEAWEIGSNLGVFTYKGKEQIGSNSWPKVVKYFETVGSSNLRHIIRFNEKFFNNKCLYKAEVLNYKDKYKDINLPFYLGSWSSG